MQKKTLPTTRLLGAVALTGLATGLLGTMPAADAAPRADAPAMTETDRAQLHRQVNTSLGLSDSDLVPLAWDATPGVAQVIDVPVNGEVLSLDLRTHSVRAPGYELLIQDDSGDLIPVAPGPVRTVRGTVNGLPGVTVAGSVTDEGLSAIMYYPDGSRMIVEPAARWAPGLDAADHVVYSNADVDHIEGTCLWSEQWQTAQGVPVEYADDGGVAGGGGVAGALFDCAELAVDADFPYFNFYGSVGNVESQINTVISTMNNQYETQVNITHIITVIVVRTSAGANPYTTNDAGALLNQVGSVWNSPPENSNPHDVVQLFSGQNFAGSTIGIAWLGSVCTSLKQSAVENIGGLNCQTDLSAHELGHNWGAGHCGCPSNTMNSGLTCANNFSAGSITTIENFRDTRTCLDNCSGATTTIPFFDDFPSATFTPGLWGLIDGAVINGLGNGEPSASNSVNLDGSGSGGDVLQTALMDASAVTDVTLDYWWQRTGSQNSPENNEDLVVEFEDATGTWVEVARHPGNGPDGDPYIQETIVLPAAAWHDSLRVRFRAISNNVGADDWFVDDISITAVTPPTNNNCATGQLVADGSFAFDTTGSTTDGPSEAGSCGTTPESDIWFVYFVQCEGTLQIDLTGLDYDAALTIYADGSCPGAADQAIACIAAPGSTSTSIPVVAGTHRIRIGGVNDAEGSGTLTLSCGPEVTPCPEDCAGGGDGFIDVSDLLAVLSQWGTNAECDVDPQPTPDGDVNVGDLLAVLAAWGTAGCPGP